MYPDEVLQSSVFLKTIYSSAEGGEAILVCPIEDYESIEWLNCSEHRREHQQLRTNDQISFINGSQVLRIYPASIYHAGVYCCIGYYEGLSSDANVVLHIIGKFMSVKYNIYNKFTTFSMNSKFYGDIW